MEYVFKRDSEGANTGVVCVCRCWASQFKLVKQVHVRARGVGKQTQTIGFDYMARELNVKVPAGAGVLDDERRKLCDGRFSRYVVTEVDIKTT